jgi:organic radical activating enzyme
VIYRVSEIFDSIQGEASWTGTPMTFVRLQGCDVGCPFCDTRSSWPLGGGTPYSVEGLVSACSRRHVCITGGEPCLHDLGPLARALGDAGHLLHLETSGRYPLRDGGRIDWITLSPKPLDYRTDPEVLARASELKYVVCEGFDPAVIVRPPEVPVYLQPCDGPGFEASLRRALQLCRDSGLRLSLQTHKILDRQ